ncbi:MAG: TonB-dependent receptor plug domain-containing protein, partial [Clostridia bacterium]|nr:TonB-dependent receptor plug domain-containing protein [Deltaproteobacteria bacterium]
SASAGVEQPSAAASSNRVFDDASLEELLAQPVVTASGGRAEDRSIAAASITTISRQDIVANNWISLSEILANVPGLYVVDNGAESSVAVRGVSGGLNAGSRILKVMINGVPVSYRSNLHALLGPEFIPVEAIQRVEVAKGPLSAVYGANAFLATVNVITRTPLAGVNAELMGRGTLIRSHAGGGGSGLVQYGSADWDLTAAFREQRDNRAGLRIRETFDGQQDRYPELFGKVSKNDIAAPKSLYVQGTRRLGSYGTVSFQGGVQQLDSSGNFQISSVLTNQSTVALNNRWADVAYENEFYGYRLRIHVGGASGSPSRNDVAFLTTDLNTAFQRNFAYRSLDAGLRLETDVVHGLTVGIGVDMMLEQHDTLFFTETLRAGNSTSPPGTVIDLITSPARREVSVRNVGPLLHAQYTPGFLPDLHLSGNVRLDTWNYFSTQYSWRAAAAYKLPGELVVKILGGRAFQVPSPDLLFASPGFGSQNNTIGARSIGGLGLVPQVVTSGEVIISGRAIEQVRFDVGGYYQRVSDLIQFEYRGADFLARNQGAFKGFGVEGEVRAEIDALSLYAGATVPWTRGEDRDGTPRPTQAGAASFPTYWTRAGGSLRIWPLHAMLTAQVRVVGERRSTSGNTLLNNLTQYDLSSYATVDITLASLGLQLLDNNETRIVFSVKNVADTRWSEPGFGGFDIPSIGRVWAIELRQLLGSH